MALDHAPHALLARHLQQPAVGEQGDVPVQGPGAEGRTTPDAAKKAARWRAR
ncbi:hypothetical protein ACU635_20105 [[Actinomadura] parvosata]|uniref:hypothetical protein n=1 Tax=[Actinomadura] parvosata TaxID=1955412 RepID=UPI00406CD1CF